MKKIIMVLVLISTFVFLLAGCKPEGKGNLTRVDVFIENKNEIIIEDEDTVTLIEDLSKQIKWEPNKVQKMARKEDTKAVFFYEVEKGMPERLYEYSIWFNESGTATIISDDKKEGYGELDKNNAKALKKYLLNAER
ncbi:hypothetical protein [Bacillus sp. AFS041924]|uniref:hypothetical protein n=1 Tax=Bacillus sp. AFS041924 TaxID=2033503 RepID=UPI000BFB95BD|nr:hypothetical protein [Bacillus sp. AFS041924]PGS51777.1 hypothetical protein COC46_11130 [Bacillus sp. AFS041924]